MGQPSPFPPVLKLCVITNSFALEPMCSSNFMLTSKGSWKELMDNPTVQSFYFKSIKKYEKNIALRSFYNKKNLSLKRLCGTLKMLSISRAEH